METDFRAALLAHAAVAAILDGPNRIAWGRLPQGEDLPYICLQRISGGYDYTQSGRVGTETPLVQIDCYAGTYADAEALAAAVITAIDSFRSTPWQGVFLLDRRADDTAEGAPGAGASTDIYRTSLDVRVTWTFAPKP